ncbi:MAG TPA: glycoside hydrolase family 3 N-terminal domain-containing protein [Spirochaetia bacterium]|jgi:beta-glucosidase|nr:glycoside hydrolase family 3 N-terminal domain-containing protein [Spirochaetia bacterium]
MKLLFWASALLVSSAALAGAAPQPFTTVADLLARMTLDEKVGQMTQPARDYLTPGDITKYRLGSVLSGGGSVPWENTVQGWRKMVGGYQDEALATPLGIPILYGVDAVHGHNNLHDATIFPHNIGLGASGDADLVFRVERATAEELKATGIPWTFAPCVAVVQDLRWGRTYEGFSKDPTLASKLAVAAVRGFQGDRLGDTGVTVSVKHFVADGGTAGGQDQGDARISQDQLDSLFLPPYAAVMPYHPGTVMASFSSINGLKMHANKDLLTGWLKESQGFDGFVISDWAAVKQLPGSSKEQIALSINAGVDMVMVPDNYRDFIADLKADIAAGKVPLTRIDDAVSRILSVKAALGLFAHPMPDSPLNLRAHQAVAREAVQKSFTLLKNDGILPLKAGKKILVMGPKADDVGSLCGGWTQTWQGGVGDTTAGKTVLEGLVAQFGEANVKFSPSGLPVEGFTPDVVVFVVGELPYAEMKGDSQTLLPDALDLRRFNKWNDNSANATTPLVTLVVSGRPLVINAIRNRSNAVAALWLPGSEAAAVADVLAGTVKPTGKLPQPWPENADQTKTVWPLGFGLTY